MPAELYILSWRDIPVRVIARRGDRIASRDLSKRFHEAIDRAAMREGLKEEAAQWRRSLPLVCGDDLEAEVSAAADAIERNDDPKMLAERSAAGGHA